jgi:tRNA A37 methylthiotransferase MiaB
MIPSSPAAPASKSVYIETVGCQMNVLDSELVIGALKRDGYSLTHDPATADLLLFNTCSVREHAEDKTFSALGRVAPFKLANPDRVIGVIGCMAQKDQEAIRDRAPYVDLVVGTGQLAKIPELVGIIRETREPQLAVSLGRRDAGRHEVEMSFESYDPTRDPEMRPTPFQAYVRIQIGCDKFCTYCVVPSTRGPEQSRHPDSILNEVKILVDQGCKEVTLIGQTVNSYVYDHGDGRRTRFSDLVSRIHDVAGLRRIKFVTNFPKDMTDDLLDAVKKQRNHDLLMLQNERSLEDSRAMIGKAVEVLVEGPSRQGAKSAPGGIRQLIGRTMTDHIAVFDGPDRLVGEILTVDIAEASGFTLYGAARTGEAIGGEGAAPVSRLPRRMGLSLV